VPSSSGADRAGDPKLLAYYFPDWHQDPRNAAWFGHGWSEWRLLQEARPRFPGHRQPRVPEGGSFDEATARAAEHQIDLAADHGLAGFLVDFYWYDDGPYLERALDEGLLAAGNLDRIEFALMWANHDLVDIFPSGSPDHEHRLLRSGRLDRRAFDEMARHVVQRYFTSPAYLKVDGRPWFSVYELGNLIEGLGGVEATRDALESLDEAARSAGFPGVHLDAVVWGMSVLPGGAGIGSPGTLLERLGFRSATSYVWIHHTDVGAGSFPAGDWAAVRRDAFADYRRLSAELPVPFYPNVTVGWDSSPRTDQRVPWRRGGYPWLPVWDPGPDEFRAGLEEARALLEEFTPPSPVITLNAWNEWTEGSYLLPDTHHGTAHLEALRQVFPLPV
jgi:Glycosyltransferase WbsX